MRRKLAFAMAFTMLLTSVPVNTLTGYAEEAVIIEELSAQDEEAVAIADLPDTEDSSGTIVLTAGSEDDALPDEILEPESSEDMTLEEQPDSDAVPEDEAAEQNAVFSIEAIDVMETAPELQNLSDDIAVHDDDNYNTGLLTDMDDEQYYYEDAGEVLTLYASASINAGHTLTYEWYDENSELVASESKIAESDITNFESLYTFECEKDTMYYCCISDEKGNQIRISYDITVDTFVWESDSTDEYNLYFNDNDAVVLQAPEVHSTYGTFTYRWYDSEYNQISGEMSESLNLGIYKNLSESEYYCYITDGNSDTTIEFSLYPSSTLRLEALSKRRFDVSLGESITMSAKAVAAVPTEFHWYFRDNSQGSQKIEVSGAVTSGNSSTLTVIPTVSGEYSCEAVLGESTDEIWFDVDIDSGLHIGDDSESSVYCKIGDTVTLTAKAYSENQYPLTYQWYYSSETSFGDSDSELIEGAKSPSLTLENITKDKFGCYECYVSDGYNTYDYMVFLEQSNTLQVTAQDLVQQVDSGSTVILKVSAQSTVSGAQLSYQWYSSDEEDLYEEISDSAASAYTTSAITSDCRYQCRVSDGCSEQRITFYLTLRDVNTENTALTFADAKELILDQPATAVIPYADTAMYFKFTPTKSGRYKIYSAEDSYKDPFGALYDNSYNLLMDNDDGEESTDSNFELLYEMTAGQTYYVKAYYCNEDNTGSYPVIVSESTEADSHTCHWDKGIVVEEPTCTQEGTIRYTCIICQKTREDYSDPLGHSYGSIHEATNATCTQEGVAYRECSRCGKIQTIKRPKSAHTYGAEQTGTLSAAVTKTYKTCQICGAEQILSVTVDSTEQVKVNNAKQTMDNLNNTSDNVADAVKAVTAMDNQALIDVEENNDTGSNTAIAMVSELENSLINSSSTDITGTIVESLVTGTGGLELSDADVSGAAVTVASVLMEASGDSSTPKPNPENSYYAEVSVKDTTTSETASSTYSIDISMNIMEKDENDNPTVFRSNVQPAAPILITIPVPSKFWNSEFELLHKGQKVNYTRDYNNQTISFYAASLSPWELNITKCNVHKYVTDQTQSIEATCCALGKAVSVCKVCQTVKTQLINKKAHTLSDWIVSAPATCTTDGQKYRYCITCNTTMEEQTIPANGGHNWVTVTDAAPTCGTNGSQHEECSVCHTTQNTTAIPATGAHNWVTVTDAAPTCGTNGSQHEECSICHTTQNTTVIPTTGAHNYVNYVVTQAPTALREGTETGSCSVCGAPHARSVAKLKATLKLTSNQVPLQLNKSANLKSLVTGLAAGDSIKSWKSDNTAIATVSKSGKVTGKKVGTAKITVTLASGEATAVIKVKVQKKAVTTTKVSVASKKVTLNVGKSTTLKPIITPVSSLQTPTYSSSNKKVAVVNSKGKVTAKAAGKTTITIKSGKKSVKVTVIVPAPEVKNIKNVPTKKTLKKGKSFTLKPTLTPKGASAKFSYSTSNKKVAAVSKNGKITAKKKGTAVITIKAGKITKSCTITVK